MFGRTCQPRRRWFRYSLRTLLIVVASLSLAFGWLALKVRQAERQRRAVDAISQGGQILLTYDYEWEESEKFRETGYCADPKPPVPKRLMQLFGEDLFAVVVGVEISGSDARPDLTHVNELPDLRRLNLYDAQIGDSALEHLDGLTNLQGLTLYNTQITDAAVKHLKGLTNLEEVTLHLTQVTSDGFNELRNALPNCKVIWKPSNANKLTDQP